MGNATMLTVSVNMDAIQDTMEIAVCNTVQMGSTETSDHFNAQSTVLTVIQKPESASNVILDLLDPTACQHVNREDMVQVVTRDVARFVTLPSVIL